MDRQTRQNGEEQHAHAKNGIFNMQTFKNLADKEVFPQKEHTHNEQQQDLPQPRQKQPTFLKQSLMRMENMEIFGEKYEEAHGEREEEMNQILQTVKRDISGKDHADPAVQKSVQNVKQRFFSFLDKFDEPHKQQTVEEPPQEAGEGFSFKKMKFNLFEKAVKEQTRREPREQVKAKMFSKMLQDFEVKLGEPSAHEEKK